MRNLPPSYKLYVLLIVLASGAAFFTAKMIVTPEKKNAVTKFLSKKGEAGPYSTSTSASTFTILSVPRIIPVATTLSQTQVRAGQDELYWHGMDTLEPTLEGAMVEITKVGEFYVALGDVIISPGPGGIGRLHPGQRVPLPRPKLWPGGRIPHMIEASLKVNEELKAAMAELREQTGIEFVSAYKEKDFVAFRSHPEHCFSHVGRIGGEQEVWLGPNCKKGEILHELMHTLGFFHEQSRPDRDEHMLIFWENIEQKYWEQFKKIPAEFQNLTDSEFDFNSLMLYPPEAFARDTRFATMAKLNGDLYTVNRQELGQLDIEKIVDIYKSEFEK